MRAYLRPFCQFAPYVALALLGIFELIDTTTMIVIAVVLMTTRAGTGCSLPRRSA